MDRWESKVDCEILKEAIEKGTPGCAGCSIRLCPIVVDASDTVAKFKSTIWNEIIDDEPDTLFGFPIEWKDDMPPIGDIILGDW